MNRDLDARPSSLRHLATVAAAAACLVGGTRLAAADGSKELRMATLAPSDSGWMKVLDRAAADVKKQTDGRVSVQYYPDGTQGDERDVIRKINLGQLDGAAVTSVGLSMIDESIRVLELPMMFDSVEELDYVADKMWSHFQKKFEKKGFTLNDRGDVGWIYFLSKNKVSSLSDLKDQKVWMWGDDGIVSAMYKKLSISGVPLGVPEVDSSLTSGRINACYGSPLAAMALGWGSKVKYMTSMPMSYAIGATVIKTDALKAIGEADQKTIKKITKNSSKKLRKQIRKDNADAQKKMKRKGVTIVETPPDMEADFRKAAEQVWKDLEGKVYSKQELADVLKYRDEYRAKHKK
ncbi:MAG: TRAP transporter substrate-binding protein DctP [Kofleriaceae bacterium]|nr:TRAP transporter substrate-binding protein DctP [Myxococcales bacterium]MCB9562458.1 TRAP transporter substrate-binding protein DctP [Kofleriaceae bacterium]MCB9574863.1 TRAP transporter substrate-binding protein DctP [Kofleriaceae bacterium]